MTGFLIFDWSVLFAAADDPAVLTEKDEKIDPTLTLMPTDPEKARFFCIMCRVALITEEVGISAFTQKLCVQLKYSTHVYGVVLQILGNVDDGNRNEIQS